MVLKTLNYQYTNSWQRATYEIPVCREWSQLGIAGQRGSLRGRQLTTSAGCHRPTSRRTRPLHVNTHTGWHRINRTIQTFNQVYKNLHKITRLTLVAHRQIKRPKKWAFKYSLVTNVLRGMIAGIDVKMKTRPLASASSCTRICGTRKVAAE